MKRLLLTGATGFIGRQCIPLLAATREYEVHAVSLRSEGGTAENVIWHCADLLEPGQVSELMQQVQPTHLLHLAWYAEPGKFWNHSENLRWVQATVNLLHRFSEGAGQRVVMAGTCAEYDWRFGYCVEGTTPLAPATLYGTCKHSVQSIVSRFCVDYEISSAWGRVFFLYGPHEQPGRLVSSVITSLLRGEPVRCSHGRQIRDFLHVRDVADAFIALLNSDVEGAVNISSGNPVALSEVVGQIADQMDSPDSVEFGAIPVPAGDPPLLVGDVGRLGGELKWKPTFDLETGLDQTIEWWAQRLGS